MKRLAVRREAVLVVLLLVEMVVMQALSPLFLTPDNLIEVVRQSAEIGLIALAMTLVIITAGIDLSVGSIVGLSVITMGMLWEDARLPLSVAVPLALFAGALMGGFNGALVTVVGIPPLIVTLATMAGFRGIALGMSQARSIRNFPEGFLWLGQGYVGGVPVQVWILAAAALLFHLALTRTAWGRALLSIGANEAATRLSGVPVNRVKIQVYVLSGFMSALAAVVYAAHVSVAKPDAGLGFELTAITAVVLGGTAVSGGEGGVLGTLIALLMVGFLRSGLTLARVPAEAQDMMVGLLLILVVAVDRWSRRSGRE
ncbi:MAG: ABC transporter permease [Armatimonadota bacterium]|nr:ABC transporter permease [bacterium]MDW8319934.1 ABC transporter permease [Armatimonadota bacterium]